MVANPVRRAQLLDAALQVLGTEGGRGLTHRAVDARADVPVGTCANYFASRADLLLAVAERAFELLAPQPRRLERLARLRGREAVAAYAEYVVERLLERPWLGLALVEVRLEAARSPAVAEVVTPFLRAGFDADVAFHSGQGLSGGAEAVAAIHHLVDGLVLDRLTVPLEPDADPRERVRTLAARLV